MEATLPGRKIYYTGSYTFGVDEKRRVQVPAKWRPPVAGTELFLVLWREAEEGPYIRVLQTDKVDQIIERLETMETSPDRSRRNIGRETDIVTLDKSGRIALPETMVREAGITDKAVLVGCLNQFQIWSPEKHERVVVTDLKAMPEAYKVLK